MIESFLQTIGTLVVSVALTFAGWVGVDVSQQRLSATGQEIPTAISLFETSLAAKITSTATSFTLLTAVDKDGTTLASSTYPFIIDEGTVSEEMVIADCTGTACTNAIRGISALTGTSSVSALKKEHRRGATIKITTGPQLVILSRILNGQGRLPNLLRYADDILIGGSSATGTVATKYYVDNVALSGAPDMAASTKGIGEKATATEAANTAADGSGNTTAPLVLTTSIATSTCQVGGAAVLVASSTSGKLDKNCWDQTANYSLTGTTTIQNLIGAISSTTYSGSTVNIDWAKGNSANVLLNQSTTITFSNVAVASAIRVFMCQDGTGSRTISAWPSSLRWQTGFAPTLTTTALKCDIISLITATSTNTVFGATSANF